MSYTYMIPLAIRFPHMKGLFSIAIPYYTVWNYERIYEKRNGVRGGGILVLVPNIVHRHY